MAGCLILHPFLSPQLVIKGMGLTASGRELSQLLLSLSVTLVDDTSSKAIICLRVEELVEGMCCQVSSTGHVGLSQAVLPLLWKRESYLHSNLWISPEIASHAFWGAKLLTMAVLEPVQKNPQNRYFVRFL